MYYLDTREAELIRILPNSSIKQLPVGDVWIGIQEHIEENEEKKEEKEERRDVKEGALIIERKSIRDLEASILDGRYREQRGRILAFCQENKAQPVYILEGSLSSATGRLQKKAIMKFINRLILRYQIAVLHTDSVQETAELIQSLIEQWTEDPAALKRTTELVKVSDGIHIQKKANSAEQFAVTCLAQCPGVSVKMAEALLQTFHSIKGVMDAEQKEIELVKVGTRKVGPVVSKRLKELLDM
jgi:ERCC4-type nuclease